VTSNNVGSTEWALSIPAENQYSPAELELRRRFVTEYLVDYNSYAAALRVGFSAAFAVDYAKRFMEEPYVRQLIRDRELGPDGDYAEETNKRRIMAALFKEANYHGPGSSHSARVSALAKLTALYGMEAPSKSETKVEVSNAPTVQFYLPENGR
jgi:hypothetical protein